MGTENEGAAGFSKLNWRVENGLRVLVR